MNYVFFAITWLFCGAVSVVFMWAIDMRNQPYDANYFDEYGLPSLILFLAGYFSVVIALFSYLHHLKEKHGRSFTKFVYRLVNIGVKTKIKTDVPQTTMKEGEDV